MNSIILMGSQIGNNVIIGAGSVVSGVIPDDVVIAGNPARVIKTLDDHFFDRKKRYIEEANLYLKTFIEKKNRKPLENEMGPFFPLFLDRNEDLLKQKGIYTNWSADEEKEIINSFINLEQIYENIEDMITNL